MMLEQMDTSAGLYRCTHGKFCTILLAQCMPLEIDAKFGG